MGRRNWLTGRSSESAGFVSGTVQTMEQQKGWDGREPWNASSSLCWTEEYHGM